MTYRDGYFTRREQHEADEKRQLVRAIQTEIDRTRLRALQFGKRSRLKDGDLERRVDL